MVPQVSQPNMAISISARHFASKAETGLTYHTSYPSFSDLSQGPKIIILVRVSSKFLFVGQVMEVVWVGVVRQLGR